MEYNSHRHTYPSPLQTKTRVYTVLKSNLRKSVDSFLYFLHVDYAADDHTPAVDSFFVSAIARDPREADKTRAAAGRSMSG